MAESELTGSQPAPAPDDMHWGINYLRGDIQDLRQDIRDVRAEARELRAEVNGQFAQVQNQFEKVQDQFAQVREQFAQVRDQFAEVREQFAEVREQFAQMKVHSNEQIGALRGEMYRLVDSRFYWTLGIMVTLSGMLAALMTALIRL